MGKTDDALKGAAGGAGFGTAVLPGVGTAVGAALGGLYGYFGDSGEDEDLKRYREQLAALSAYQPVNLGQAATANQGAYGGYLTSALDLNRALAMGQGPSAAEIAARNAMMSSAANQQALAAGAAVRGVSPGAAYRNAANVTAGVDANTLAALSEARAREQIAAIGAYGGLGAQAQGQSLEQARFNAEQQNQFAVQRARLEQEERNRQLQALSAASGINPQTGPGLGDALLAGGANAYASYIGSKDAAKKGA